jgi:hypothetical protein
MEEIVFFWKNTWEIECETSRSGFSGKGKHKNGGFYEKT